MPISSAGAVAAPAAGGRGAAPAGQPAPERQPRVAVERRPAQQQHAAAAAAAAAARRRRRPRAAGAARRPSGRAAPRPAARGPCGCDSATRSVSRGWPSSSDTRGGHAQRPASRRPACSAAPAAPGRGRPAGSSARTRSGPWRSRCDSL